MLNMRLNKKSINQDVYNCKGVLTSNVGLIIESIINERPVI